MATKVLIVEDEIMAQKSLIRVLTQHFPDMQVVGTTTSVKSTVAWLKEPANSADIIFMDVELSDGVCFEIFRQVNVNAKVIMTTAYDSYALKAFEAGSVDYLLKPIRQKLKNFVFAQDIIGIPPVTHAKLGNAAGTIGAAFINQA